MILANGSTGRVMRSVVLGPVSEIAGRREHADYSTLASIPSTKGSTTRKARCCSRSSLQIASSRESCRRSSSPHRRFTHFSCEST